MPETRPAQVAIAHTNEKHRTVERAYNMVREVLEHLGGMSRFVRHGQTVLIKPNQTVYYSAEEGCTTDPVVVGAVIRLCKEAGAAKVQVGESSGGFFNSMECMKVTGMAALAEREGAEVVDLGSKTMPTRSVPIPNGIVMKECPLPVALLDADVIIDCPKAKNHHVEPISGALKNWVGTVNQEWREYNHGTTEMYDRFMDIMTVTKPHLCIADALIIGEGDGPIADIPRWCGCVLASADPVAMDVALCKLLQHDVRKMVFIDAALRHNLGVAEPIEYLGVPLDQVSVPAWPGHTGYDYLPLNLLVGHGVELPGTVGHVKSVLDSMNRRGELVQVLWLKGTPTIMIGAVEDPHFEEHLKEGPYVVFDDHALPKYKNDPRVHFVGGHPVLRRAMPELMKQLGVGVEGKGIMKFQEFERYEMHSMRFGTREEKIRAIAEPAAAVGLALAALFTVAQLITGVMKHRHID